MNGYGVNTPSASFVRFLIDEFGSSRYLSSYAHTPKFAPRAVIEAVFEHEIGVRLDDALSDWRTKPPPRHANDLCLRIMDCGSSTPVLVDND